MDEYIQTLKNTQGFGKESTYINGEMTAPVTFLISAPGSDAEPLFDIFDKLPQTD